MRVRKTVIRLTLLCDACTDLTTRTLESIAAEMDTGDFLGDWDIESTTLVDPAKVESECVALRNDGSFFEEDQ
tara:strand:- start:133 stop:351 length:219 start_codon:yes stop_codon:yes gene_type:complete